MPQSQYPSLDHLRQLHASILDVGEKATSCLPPAKVQAKAAEFLQLMPDFDDMSLRAVDALGYALDLSLFAPSMTGQTAVDRVLRNGKLSAPEEREAAELLRRSVFRIIEINEVFSEGLYAATDLASEESFIIFDPKMLNREGARWALRTCMFENIAISVGPVTPVNDDMMVLAHSFIDKGSALKTPLRCAEELYRYFIRNGNPLDGVNPDLFPDDDDEFPFDAADGPVHAVAFQWAEKDSLPEPTETDLRLIRSEAHADGVHESFCACFRAHDLKLGRLATAYDRALVIQLETIHRRSSAGIRTTHETLDDLAIEIRQGIKNGDVDPAAGPLFDDLCRRAKQACAARVSNKGNREELDKVLARIQALRSKTVAQGCTEAEALIAAEKVSELLDRYGLSLSEIDMKVQSCAGEGIETNRRRRSSLDDCSGTIAAFCDCRTWHEITSSGNIRHIFFGLPADVAGARVLYEKIEEAFETETASFKRGKLYESRPSGQRRSATSSFQSGLGHGICAKLDMIKEARTSILRKSGGRDLVPLKSSIIEDELSALGLSLRAKYRTPKSVFADAYRTGVIKGETIALEDKIAAKG